MRHHKPYGMHCGCPKPMDTVVYPTKYNEVHTCSENEVKHVHPSHTNVVNHHLTKNTHVYPHSTSYDSTFESVDVYGGSYQVPRPPRPNVGAGPMPGPGVSPQAGPMPGPGVPPQAGPMPGPGAPMPPMGPNVAPGSPNVPGGFRGPKK
ncbi:CotD family spore coat protein [Aquibacillus sediminis]|uniref:CotD family spore coat protein n=1 Tax=Aquibacillus sediminis TaxID=2574734 RepID=UPI001108CBD7|nr:CotD family spore coat protein [Aquibacillus sediminis]